MSVQRTSVGLDVHARSVVASALDGVTGEVIERRLTPAHADVAAWVGSLPRPVAVVYEAGPTGFGLARFLTAAGIRCEVAAPSKLQRPAGDRVKTDARDARHLARLLHLGQVVAVAVPDAATEAARDLVRAREDVRGDLMSARHRVSKLLLRQGIVYAGGKAWTGVHDTWLRAQRFDSPVLQLAFDTSYETMLAAVDRRDRLDAAIAAMAADSPFTPVVTRLGLVPTEYSSGASRSQGGITKTGNAHARRLLIEAAWHHRPAYRVPGVDLRRRWDVASPAARDRGRRANRRLHERWARFDARGKLPVVANTAIARELAGWCWSLATLED